MYQLLEIEKHRLVDGIQAAYAIPFIHDITDFVWEAVFSYMKNIPVVDPLKNTRKKLLYDIVDPSRRVGWSAKAIQKPLSFPLSLELVIQRADIFKKATALNFDSLNVNTPPHVLGEALLRHWYLKVENDAATQDVVEKRLCILVKSVDRRRYAYFEEDIVIYDPKDLYWQWTDNSQTGLQGVRKVDERIVFRWYPNQKQFFERFDLFEEKTFAFTLEPVRLPPDEVVSLLLNSLNNLRYL